ncbi:hypothetical protein BT69DRAFT_1277888 [Atractiella rhizophila]|nr:hypothetical protein BT69DRAFT_1277888 [Atractiella rhizophila]
MPKRKDHTLSPREVEKAAEKVVKKFEKDGAGEDCTVMDVIIDIEDLYRDLGPEYEDKIRQFVMRVQTITAQSIVSMFGTHEISAIKAENELNNLFAVYNQSIKSHYTKQITEYQTGQLRIRSLSFEEDDGNSQSLLAKEVPQMHMGPERLQRLRPKAALNLGGAQRPSAHASTTRARGGEWNEAPLSTKKHGRMQRDRDEEGNSEAEEKDENEDEEEEENEEEEEEEEEMPTKKRKKTNSTRKMPNRRTQRAESNEGAPAQVLKKAAKKKVFAFDGFWADESGRATMEFTEGKVYLPEQYYNEQILTFNKAMFLRTFVYEVGRVDQTLIILQQIGKGQGHVALGFPERGSFYENVRSQIGCRRNEYQNIFLNACRLYLLSTGWILSPTGQGYQSELTNLIDKAKKKDGQTTTLKSKKSSFKPILPSRKSLKTGDDRLSLSGKELIMKTFGQIAGEGTQLDQLRWTDGKAKRGTFLNDSDVEIERAGFQLPPPAFHKRKTARFRHVEHDDKDFDDFLVDMMEEGEDNDDV